VSLTFLLIRAFATYTVSLYRGTVLPVLISVSTA